LRILFCSHTGRFGGAEAAMLRLADDLHREHEIAVACPQGGELHAAVLARGLPHFMLAGTRASLALHVLRTPRAVAELATSGAALWRVCRRYRPDIVHANSARAGLIAAVAAMLGAPPVVVQVHDMLPDDVTGRAVRRVIRRTASLVVAVSNRARANFALSRRGAPVTRVYPAIDAARFSRERVTAAGIRAELGLAPDAVLIGQLAQITSWKRQDASIRALATVRRQISTAHLLIAGAVAFRSERYENENYERSLHDLVSELELQDAVHFLGHRSDVPELLKSLDLLVLPSEEEPFGLAGVEAMAMGTPVIVSSAGGAAEFVEDGVTGRVLDDPDPRRWGEAIAELLRAPVVLRAMGAGAARVDYFAGERYAREMLELYRSVGLGKRRRLDER